jgi:2-keto-4-pentenoate hydratase/2-oxohepta-3-ene-1,7-dioic acid hydratase in catechol pathway
MRIHRYSSAATNNAPSVAVAIEDGVVVDLNRAWRAVHTTASDESVLSSTIRLIEAGPAVWAMAGASAEAAPPEARVDTGAEGFRWLCPIDRLASLRDFLAFEDHVRRGADRRGSPVPAYWYEAPVYYKGNHRQVIGPGEACPWPPYSHQLDFELELGMIVGRAGRDVPRERAGDHIFGFTVFNDFSARDVQAKEMSAWLGPAKGKDFCNAFGPCIVTADELGTEPDLEMVCRVNGEEWGRARSSQAHWRWSDMIAHVSAAEEIWPGDVYGSGTPGGCCGIDLGRRLSPGDVVELEIEGIGVLRNLIGVRSERRGNHGFRT